MDRISDQRFGALSNVFSGHKPADDLSSGIQASFGIIGYKGKVWSIRYRGDDRPLLREDGDGPRNSIELVILKGSDHIAKTWYESGYVEGANSPPDCFSNDGIRPDPTSAKRQSPTCATCPRNVWGSRVTPAGKKAKDCADVKRLAIAPLADIPNDAFGGPMLLRVPPASLQDLAIYGSKMQAMGFPYYALGTKVSFDQTAAHPKFLFSPIRALNDDEGIQVLKLREDPRVAYIVAEAPEQQTTQQPAFELSQLGAPASVFGVNPGGVFPKAAPADLPPRYVAPATPEPANEVPAPEQAPASEEDGIPAFLKRGKEAAPKPAVTKTGFGTVAAATTPASGNGKGRPTLVQPAPQEAAPKVEAFKEARERGASIMEARAEGLAAEPAPQAQAPAQAASWSSFEDEIDAQIDNLLPPA